MKALVGGTLIHTHGAAPVKNVVVLIEDNKILRVGTPGEIQIPKDAEVIRADGKWIIPGLCDAHVHFFQSGGLYTRPDIIDLRTFVPYAEELSWIRAHLPDTFARYLRCGITAVVDVGGPMWNFEVRDLARKTALAPRVAVAGPLISTYQPTALTTDDAPIIKVESPEAARAMVRQQAARKTDLIKMWLIVNPRQDPRMHLPLVQAVVEESHAHHIRVAIHATELETARMAVEGGADILVHSVFDAPVDQAFVDAMKKNGTIYVTTIMVRERYDQVLGQKTTLTKEDLELANPHTVSTLYDLNKIPPEEIPARRVRPPQAFEPTPVALENVKKLHDAGITIAAGTDAGNIGTLHGPALFYELELLARAGLKPIDILTAATLNGARVAGWSDRLGSIEEGKLADLVILNSNPLEDIRNVSDIHGVIKDGRLFMPGELLKKSPVDIVQQQINTYNAHNVDAFLATYSPQIEIYRDGNLAFSGHDAMRKRYQPYFEDNPKLHCEITDRKVDGQFITDHEKITGLADGGSKTATAKYEVQGEVIKRVWFST